jgi:polyhydroxybutyrate depolymerase
MKFARMARHLVHWFSMVAALCVGSAALAQGSDWPLRRGPIGRLGVICSEDVRRYCTGVTPGGGRIIQCLANYRNQVSPACRSQLAALGPHDGFPYYGPRGYGAGPNSYRRGSDGYGYGPSPDAKEYGFDAGAYGPGWDLGGYDRNAYGRGPKAHPYNPDPDPPGLGEPNGQGSSPDADGYDPYSYGRSRHGLGPDGNGDGPGADPLKPSRPRGYGQVDTAPLGPSNSKGSLVTDDGLTRTYVIHTPVNYDPKKTYPLVLLFHGGYGSGARILSRTRFASKADNAGFIVVAPDGVDNHWNDGRGTTNATVDDVGFVRQLIKALEARLAIDTRRIYATGISNGGKFTARLGCELSDTLAAVGTVAGPIASELLSSCKPRPISVVGIQGTADPLNPIDGGESGGGYALAKGGMAASATETMKLWAKVNGCNLTQNIANIPPGVNDGTRVVKYSYSGCSAGNNVDYYIVQGMGHGWPPAKGGFAMRVSGSTSHNINATDVLWNFFDAHSR